MDRQLKQRVVGAALLVAFGVIFIPIFLDNGGVDSPVPPTMNIPPAPTEDVSNRVPELTDQTIEELEAQANSELEPPPAQPGPAPLVNEAAPAAVDPPPSPGSAVAAAARATPNPTTPPRATSVKPASASSSPPSVAPPIAKRESTPTVIAKVTPAPSKQAAALADLAPSGWTVQLGSFASDVNATHLVDKLKAAGYKAYSERRVEQGTSVFKVRVGPVPGRAEAERMRERIESQFTAHGMLVPVR